MHLIEQYQYPNVSRITQPNGIRHYICPQTGKHLASVTTILSATADKTFLKEWRQRVGEEEAERIKREALGLGTLMHTHLDNYIHGQPRPGGNNVVRVQAERMADTIIQRGLNKVGDVWGSEVVVYYPELYGGATDLVGLYEGRPAVMDFKTANKMRTREMINDYLLQLCAYGTAHDNTYGTTIRTGVIFMVDRDYNFEEFVIEGDEFVAKTSEWIDRLEQYLLRG